jgi:hypothetical protein
MPPELSDSRARGQQAEQAVAAALRDGGWTVSRATVSGNLHADLVAEREGLRYVVEVKATAEGRSDRLIPLWSQACLQAARVAGSGGALAAVVAPRIAPAAADRILDFAERYAPEVAVAILDFAGFRRFRGTGLEGLDADGPDRGAMPRGTATTPADLFSDLNQWLLKVLLAPAIPENLLSSPRERFRNASQLARAAGVSPMSAHRFVQQLNDEGHLDRSARDVRLMDLGRLLARWQATAARPTREVPVRVLLGDPGPEAARIARESEACLGFFAAADALHLGFVHGVPPYVYVRRVASALEQQPKNLSAAERHEVPDLILRQPRAPHSVFRAMVRRDGMGVSDVLQVWLDVSGHPSRGQEQADLIRRRVLQAVLDGDPAR